MTPYDPESPAPSPEPPIPTPHPPFWSYLDLLFLTSLFVPSLLVAALVTRPLSGALGKPLQALLAQLIAYALIFGALYGVFQVRYGQPFWRSLGWKFPVPGAGASFFWGPLLAFAVGFLGTLLRTPEIPNPFQQMFQDRTTVIAFAIFVVIIGPVCEELAFRGFLMPLLMRSFGAASGIVLTGVLFGCLHGSELSWSWRHMLLIATAGTVFGWVRYRTGSTAPAAFMHASYNLTQFGFFLLQNRTV